MFTSYFNLIRFSVRKSDQSLFNLFSYSDVLVFKYTTIHLLSFYISKKNNLFLVVKDLSTKWGLFFLKNLLILFIFVG